MVAANGIQVQFSVVESHNSLDANERYDASLCRVFSVLRDRHPSLDHDVSLLLALKVMNCTLGQSGLVPTLSVFGVLPSLPVSTTDYPIHRKRMRAMQLSRE